MADWDASDSDDDKPETKPQTQPTAKAVDNWDDSEASEDEQPQQTQSTKSSPQKATANAWDESEESDNAQTEEQTQGNGTSKSPSSELAETPNNEENEAEAAAKAKAEEKEKLRKLKKKQQNYKNKQKRKNRRKNKKKQALPPPKTQSSIPKNQDEIISMSSDDSSSDSDNNKGGKKKKMESYDDRMRTDNDILFEGHEVAKQNRLKQEKAKKVDNRPMLSGEVTLKGFPLGSSKDCEHFADQITGHLDQKLYEESINTNDIFLFYKKLLSANVLENLDMVDTKELCTKLNSLLASKQKAWHTKKNPKGKKKKKPQWIVADKFNSGKTKKTGHVDGGFDPDEYSLFD